VVSETTIASGLKEALRVGIEHAVNVTGGPDGYFRNQVIKILRPEPLQVIEKGLRAVGYGPHVDEFVLSMNRAAKRAAPAAKPIVWDAITAMSIDDARQILRGGPTAATENCKAKTTARLTTAFRPIVAQAMHEVGVTRQYQELVGRSQAIPVAKSATFDLDGYVVSKALAGLFSMVGEE
jgi:Protein of unknown function (DUF4197)